MIYPIVKFGNPVLEKPAETVTVFDDELQKLIEDMFESMYAAHGVGLAAPQIGIGRRIAVIDVTFKEDPKAKLVLINPEIIHTEGTPHAKRRMPQHSRFPRERNVAPIRSPFVPRTCTGTFSKKPEKNCWPAPSCMKPITSTASSTSAISARSSAT